MQMTVFPTLHCAPLGKTGMNRPSQPQIWAVPEAWPCSLTTGWVRRTLGFSLTPKPTLVLSLALQSHPCFPSHFSSFPLNLVLVFPCPTLSAQKQTLVRTSLHSLFLPSSFILYPSLPSTAQAQFPAVNIYTAYKPWCKWVQVPWDV